jgi:hypothetical protein
MSIGVHLIEEKKILVPTGQFMSFNMNSAQQVAGKHE